MECVLLGSGGMMPMPYRDLTSLVVRRQGRHYQFDAGEGCQVALKRSGIGIKALEVVALSHLHGDHILGLPGLLMLRAQVAEAPPLTLLGPPGTGALVRSLRQLLDFYLPYPLTIKEWSPCAGEVAYRDARVSILWRPLNHRVLCLGYRLEESTRPGRFFPGRAAALGIPAGPLWGRLQRGARIELPDGRQVDPQEVLGPERPGRVVVYAVDTRPCQNLEALCRDADLAFLDGMFAPEEAADALAKGHLTISEAAAVAARAGVRRAVLTHISPRYGPEEVGAWQLLLDREARPVTVGADLARYTVAFHPED